MKNNDAKIRIPPCPLGNFDIAAGIFRNHFACFTPPLPASLRWWPAAGPQPGLCVVPLGPSLGPRHGTATATAAPERPQPRVALAGQGRVRPCRTPRGSQGLGEVRHRPATVAAPPAGRITLIGEAHLYGGERGGAGRQRGAAVGRGREAAREPSLSPPQSAPVQQGRISVRPEEEGRRICCVTGVGDTCFSRVGAGGRSALVALARPVGRGARLGRSAVRAGRAGPGPQCVTFP